MLNRKLRIVGLSVLILIYMASFARAADFHVITDQEFQAALSTAAINGEDDTVFLEAGTYYGLFRHLAQETNSLTIKAEIGLSPDQVVLDGENLNRVLFLDDNNFGNNFTVEGITIQNGSSESSGAGIEVRSDSGTITLTNNTITGNRADDDGGGGVNASSDSGTITLTNNTITDNTAHYDSAGGVRASSHSGIVILTNNTVTGNTASYVAGGVSAETYSGIVTLTNNIITSNWAGSFGGGVSAGSDSGTITLAYNTITDNTADDGGGVNASSDSGTIELTNNTITGNTATAGYGSGGGVYALSYYSGTFDLTNNTITDNTAYYGGGVYAKSGSGTIGLTENIIIGNTAIGYYGGAKASSDSGTINLTNNTITGNTAYGYGGVYTSSDSGTTTLTNNTITGNTAYGNDVDGGGGGVYTSSDSGTITLTNNTVTGNTADDGGGVYASSYSGIGTLTNNTITGNMATDGGGLYAYLRGVNAIFYIYNNIIWGNTANLGGSIYLVGDGFKYGYNNDYEDLYGLWDFIGNNINADPLFVDVNNEDYHLLAGSPCIDAGDNDAPELPDKDIDGEPRVMDSIVDIGADEYTGFIPVPNISVTPVSHDFGSINVLSNSPHKSFKISNTGNAGLVIDTIILTGINTSEFNIQNDNCTGQTVALSGNCTVEVVFSPTTAGTKGATLSIPSNDYGAPTQEVPLTGTGIENLLSLRWPLSGVLGDRTINLGFGDDWVNYCNSIIKKHTGFDVTAVRNEEVYASESGVVKAAQTDPDWGGWVTIEHTNSIPVFTTVYWHVIPLVGVGETVTKGLRIATIADLDSNTHFHFGIRLSNYSNISNRGALPQTDCEGDPEFPEYFIDPETISYVYGINPIPDIKANSSDGPITLVTSDTLSIAISLDPGSYTGTSADWYIVVNTPSGWQSFNISQMDYSTSGLSALLQDYGLISFGSAEIFSTSSLSAGTYTFYFAINLSGQLYYDSVEATVEVGEVSAPTGFTVSASGSTITLSWNAVSGAEGYNLYYGLSSGDYLGSVDLGNTTGQTYGGIPDGTYYLAITAYAGSNESSYSDEVSVTVESIISSNTVNLPVTGQTTCYDENGNVIACQDSGQDGEIQTGVAWPDLRFTDNADSTVTDNLTGLIWTQDGNLPGGTKTWQEALDYVAGMNAGTYQNFGYTDWRLPNINELESLVNAEEGFIATWLNTQIFINVQSSQYWSSTTNANNTVYAWYVYMNGGYVFSLNKYNYNFYVWPVRAGSGGSFGNSDIWKTGQTTVYSTGDDGDTQSGVEWPSPRFTDNGDSTVTDNLTGLIWTQDSNLSGGTMTWQEALDYVAGMNAGTYPNLGYTDWRLPNQKELLSLIDRSRYVPGLPTNHPFVNVPSSGYWSSTTYANDTVYAWYVHMDYGNVNGTNKSYYIYVWPVRGGSSGK